MTKSENFIKSSILVLFLIAFDQLLKYMIRSSGGFYICNSGIAFGIKIPLELFYLVWIIIILGILFWDKKADNLVHLAIVAIISGALSNLIDRLSFGCVIDFINLRIWPVFNPADILIAVGTVILLGDIFFKGNNPYQNDSK